MIVLNDGALTDPQLPARASNVYTTDARLGGIGRVASNGWNRPGGIGRVPPKQKSWLRRCREEIDESSTLSSDQLERTSDKLSSHQVSY